MTYKELFDPVSIDVFRNTVEIGDNAANVLIETVRSIPDALILLPTGITPLPMYNSLIKKFEEDRSINFSKVTIFNLDEYVGLSKGHPLSYSHYMQKAFYEKLDKISKERAPEISNRFIPDAENGDPAEAARKYEKYYAEAVSKSQRQAPDLAIIGLGGAYLEKVHGHLKICGGHIGFNEPGSKINDRTRVVKLTEKTQIDTAFRFQNLRYCSSFSKELTNKVPGNAITLGIANILEAKKILMLASSEDKAPVLVEAFKKEINPEFPVTYLRSHQNVSWMIDKEAAVRLPQIQTPWDISGQATKWTNETMRQAIIGSIKQHPKLKLEDIDEKNLMDLRVPREIIEKFGGMEKIKTETSKYLSNFVHKTERSLLPKREKVIVFSPHPDDDVITMYATIQKLLKNENDVWIVYMVNGENSVRNTDATTQKIYKDLYKKHVRMFHIDEVDDSEKAEMLRHARVTVRKKEAIAASKILGMPEHRLMFLDLPYYYHRGFVDVNAIDLDKDVRPVKDILLQIRPTHIFYSSEADPHGAHGLCAEIINKALEWLLSFWNCSFWGYRGVHEEWPLHKCEDLIIVPFDTSVMRKKLMAIRVHKSQMKPQFPSWDSREFFERARDRNRLTGHILEMFGCVHFPTRAYAEVFKKVSHAEFIRTK